MAPTLTDYSQSGEQEAIQAWAARHGPGRFLDIGAGDGQTFSNTRALVEAGWGGVCVEPAPWALDKLTALYARNPRVHVVGAVVTAERRGLIRFVQTRDDHLSSTDEARLEKWPTVEPEPVTLAAVRLYDLLDYFVSLPGGLFSVVSIDAEGTTMELLRSYQRHPSWKAVRCLCAEVEGRDDRRQVEELRAREAGWKMQRTPNNVILTR